jgi:hypothetical protein
MALPPAGTFDVDILSQGQMKQALENMRDSIAEGMKQTAARAVLSGSDQSINGSTVTKINLNAETFDFGGNFDPTTNHNYVAPVDGAYDIRASVGYEAVPAGVEIHARLHVNNTVLNYGRRINQAASGTQDMEVPFFDTVELLQGDAVDLRAYHTNGSALDVVHSNQKTFLSIHLLGSI